MNSKGIHREVERKERMDISSLMERILSDNNLNRVYLQVVRNKGAEGVDGMKYTELLIYLIRSRISITGIGKNSRRFSSIVKYLERRLVEKKNRAGKGCNG